MLQTAANPGGLPIEAFDQIRAGVIADRSQFSKDRQHHPARSPRPRDITSQTRTPTGAQIRLNSAGVAPSSAAQKWKQERSHNYAHFFSGSFLKGTGPAHDVDYATAWVLDLRGPDLPSTRQARPGCAPFC
jgi:hypothetical protein